MRSPLKFRLIAYLFCLPLSTACQSANPIEKDFNAYLPYTYIEESPQFEFPPQKKTTQTEEEKDDTIWDVSSLDISYIRPDKKLISFTFDDAPSKSLESILAVFTGFNEQNPDCKATATVFFNGTLIDENSLPLLHTARILGFELGNHTHSHLDLTSLSQDRLAKEIEDTDKILSLVDGHPYHLFRAPFGLINDTVKASVHTPIIDWTIDTLDWTGKSADEIFNTVHSAKFDGAIVLMHDGYPATVEALKRLLPILKEEGYQVVSVSALAKAHGCVLKNGKVYIRARK